MQATKRGPQVLDKPVTRNRADVSLSAFAFMFSEIVQYSQQRVGGIQELEDKLAEFGYRVGVRMLEVVSWREKSSRRETRMVNMLHFIQTSVYRSLFGRPADSLEKSREAEDVYMIIDNDPLVNTFISLPSDLSQLNCAAFSAGVVRACLERGGFPAKVDAHNTPTPELPRRTTIRIKFDGSVLEREKKLEARG